MFKRREKTKLSFKIRKLLWPNIGWKRTLRYFSLRIVRLSAAPEPLARAIACGVSASFFPVFGIHALMAVAMAFAMRANMLAAALATLAVPPVVLPLMFSLDFLVGRQVLAWAGIHVGEGGDAIAAQAATGWHDAIATFDEFFLPALVGSGIFMVLVWPATYMAARKLIATLAHRHRKEKEGKRMIIGIGEDTCDIRRIEKTLARHGERFLARCFTPTERAKAATRKGGHEPAATLAKRFAAKEACAKALGTGFSQGVALRDIGVVNAPSGAPTLHLTGGAALRLAALVPNGGSPRIHLTLGDEYPYAKALVIIEGLDQNPASSRQ